LLCRKLKTVYCLTIAVYQVPLYDCRIGIYSQQIVSAVMHLCVSTNNSNKSIETCGKWRCYTADGYSILATRIHSVSIIRPLLTSFCFAVTFKHQSIISLLLN